VSRKGAKAQRKKIIGANNIILCLLCGKKRHAKAQRRKENKLSVPIISSFVYFVFVEKSVTQRRKGAKKKNYRCQ